MLEQTSIQADVELEVHEDYLIIRRASSVRTGWDEAFKKMAELQDDVLEDAMDETNWDLTEWEWQ